LRILAISAALTALVAAVVACTPLSLVNALTPTHTYLATANLEYGRDIREKLDVYMPRPAAEVQGPRNSYPVVVFFYGGS